MAAKTWDALIEGLRGDRRSGATALTRRAVEALPSLAGCGDGELRSGLRRLAGARPPFGSLFRVASRVALAWERGAPLGAALAAVSADVEAELAEQHTAVVAAAALLGPGRSVLTISASSLVRDALLSRRSEGLGSLVTYLESRPGGEGAALAGELAREGVRTRLAPDAAAARLVAEADVVLLGGDTLCGRGLIHKLGTLGLALAARERGVPVYALLGSLKILPAPVRGWAEDAAEDDASTARGSGPEAWACLFDLTPLELLSGVITEHGLLTPRDAAELGSAEPIHPWLADLLEQ